ncbi:MAG TPA: SHD1 domain-containing protein [Lacipirellulaceae bacterium]
MTRSQLQMLLTIALTLTATAALARTWTDSTGKYNVDADLIAFNDKTVILQREDKQLGAIDIKKLSQGDQEYLKSKEAEERANEIAGKKQTWTLRDGMKVPGRVVDYARRDLTVQRRRGKIYVNDRQFENLPEIYQRMLPKVVAQLERINQPDKRGLEAWLVRQKGQPRTFTVEGVIMELENGDEYGVPFFFFSDEDLAVLKPGWDEWLAAHQDEHYDKQADHAFMVQSLAAARQHDREVQRQIAIMQLNLQAVQAGLTSLWEVTLYPARGNAGPPLWVVQPGRNSQQAAAAALSQNPGYVAGPVRKVGGF